VVGLKSLKNNHFFGKWMGHVSRDFCLVRVFEQKYGFGLFERQDRISSIYFELQVILWAITL